MKISQFTNSEIGSHHWAATLLSFVMRTGEALHEGGHGNTDAHIRHWGEVLKTYATELNDYLQSQPEPEHKYDDVRTRLERIETYLEQGFLAANFQHTENVGKVCASTLVRHPKDINTMALVTKLDNDQQIIEPAMRTTNASLWRHIVSKYGGGRVLKYFEMNPPQPKSNLHVSK